MRNLTLTSLTLLSLATTGWAIWGQGPAEELTAAQREELEAKSDRLNERIIELHQSGKPSEALRLAEELLGVQRKLSAGEDSEGLADALNSVGFFRRALGRFAQALPAQRDALAMFERIHNGGDHPELAVALNNTGLLLKSMSRYEEALPYYQRALAMRKRLYQGQDHSQVATSLNNLGGLLSATGRNEEALAYYREALAMWERIHQGRDHPLLATGRHNMGMLLLQLGRHEAALDHMSDALTMRRRVYQGHDHPLLAQSLHDMAGLLGEMGRNRQALEFSREALAMLKRVFAGRDHPLLTASLDHIGGLLFAMGRYEQALTYFTEALASRRSLFGETDHPEVAAGLNNMGCLLSALGRHGEASRYCREALEMRRRVFAGRDHPDVASSLNNMAALSLAESGREESALAFCFDALEMERRYAGREIATSSLNEAQALVNTFQDSRSLLLSASRHVADTDTAVAEKIWAGKSFLADILRERQRLARLERSESKAVRDAVTELRVNRRELTALLQRPPGPGRDRAVKVLTEKIERGERSLAELLPGRREPADPELAHLASALGEGRVFIDLYRYRDVASDREDPPARYVAFVLSGDGVPTRVELGPAEPIEAAVLAWRTTLVEWSPQLSPTARAGIESKTAEHGKTLRELVWRPIEEHLPPESVAVYVCCDADLGRLPFAALPAGAAMRGSGGSAGDPDEGRPGRVLLEEYSIAVVPSGRFLLDHLTERGGRTGGGALLLAGGIDYGDSEIPEWPRLKGSAREFVQVKTLARGREVIEARGTGATADWLLANLAQARFAHLATHAEFREREFADEQARRIKARRNRIAGLSPTMSAAGRLAGHDGAGVRNPLGYVGVVMAGANNSEAAVVSGLDVLDLDLSGMGLAVLSACETGLGEHTGDAGVANLALAFHVAGCDNVIASLWQVDDQATAALMAKFYHELWADKKPPIEALREAQLLVYRRPDLIPDLAGTRGAPKRKEALQVRPTDVPEAGRGDRPERTPPKYWAAFVLSGVGE